MRVPALLVFVLALGFGAQSTTPPQVEILRDRWGIPHVFATSDDGGFYGVGYASAEDRLLQMEIFRRRTTGRLAEVYGARQLASDRKFRIAGVPRHCEETAAALPEDIRGYLAAYAAGVNAWVEANPDAAAARLSKLGVSFAPWTTADCICSWLAVAEIFDRLYDEGPVTLYHDFRRLALELGEEGALAQPGMMIDDAAAVVSESEMAKDPEAYARLINRPHIPGYWTRSLPDDLLRFSHAWAVGGGRSSTGAPILESDPQTSVNSPPLWYEFHLSTPRYNVRGIGFAGSPAMLIGFNRTIAWGASALGAGSAVTFIEKLSADGRGYVFGGRTLPFERRTETITVKGAASVEVETLRTRHGFVFDALASNPQSGEAYVSHYPPIEQRATSLTGLLNMMGAGDWAQFRDAMQSYFSPGLHVVYADVFGNIGYQTLNYVPLTRRTPRMALEGWTGADEIAARIPLDEIPHLFNPDSQFVSHANNLPVGSWYPYDLGIGTGGIGHTSRSLRLVDLLSRPGLFSVDLFESAVHRDSTNAAVAALFPSARKVAAETLAGDRAVAPLLDALRDWDLRFRASEPSYPAAMALSSTALLTYRRSGLATRLGGGEGGINHLARLLREQYPAASQGVPQDAEVRGYLTQWLRAAAQELPRLTAEIGPSGGRSRHVHSMPYQANGPLALPSLDASLDTVSPPLACGEVGTIWSQHGNSYTQIVDLSDPDNSRTLLPPGISEDPRSPFHTDQIPIWIRGETHPAPLSRSRVEALAVSRVVLDPPSRLVAPAARRR